MSGDKHRQVEVGLQPRAAGHEVLGFVEGTHAGGQRLAVTRRAVLYIERLTEQAQGLDEFAAGGKVRAALGQSKTFADLAGGLQGHDIHLRRARTSGRGQQGRGAGAAADATIRGFSGRKLSTAAGAG